MGTIVRRCTALLVLTASALGAATLPAGAATHTVHGTVTVSGGVSLKDCAGADDQDDIHQGTVIRLRDDSHRQIARAKLGVGRAGGGGLDRCVFRFTMRDVASSPSYSFVIADRDPEGTVTRAKLAKQDWRVRLTPS
jgi:hypothetical protein